MYVAVYLPLLTPALAAFLVRPLADRLEPRLATWLLTGAALVLAGSSTVVLGLLALAGVLRIPPVAHLAHLSTDVIGARDTTGWPVGLLAALLLAGAASAALLLLWRRVRALLAVALDAACLPGPDPLVVVEDEAADAFAMPGLPGRIVVSRGMLDALRDTERAALLAHERAHLRAHHYLFSAAVHLCAAANPLLRPFSAAVGYTVERWADEHAASVTGDRRTVARAIGKAALAGHRGTPAPAPGILGGLPGRVLNPVLGSVLGRGLGRPLADLGRRLVPLPGRGRARTATPGPVPRRVAALLSPPPQSRPLLIALTLALLAVTACCALDAAHELHELLQLAHGS